MSGGGCACDLTQDTSQSPSPLKDEAPLNSEEQEDDADLMDDSSSSYCTAPCSLSECSEVTEDGRSTPHSETSHMPSADSSLSTRSLRGSTGSSTTMSKDGTPSQDQQMEEARDTDVSDGRLSEVSLGQGHMSGLPSRQSPVKPDREDLQSSTADVSAINVASSTTGLPSRTPCETVHLDPELIDHITPLAQNEKQRLPEMCDSETLPPASRDPLLRPWDYIRGSMTATHMNTMATEGLCSAQPRFCTNAILVTPVGTQQNSEHGTQPRTDPARPGHSPGEDPRGRSAERQPLWAHVDVGGVGEVQGTGPRCEEEQPGLSLMARNRKASASCIPTLTASKHKSGIPPHCYSERILATGQQHQSHSPPDSWRLQGARQSGSVPRRSSSPWRNCTVPDNAGGRSSMGTKLVETHSEVKSLSNLALTRPFHPEGDYLDVSNSICRSSTQVSIDKSFHGWSEDVLSFKLPLSLPVNDQNTSACSEASSVECIDVALESLEHLQSGTKTVPKRQIQLKKRETVEWHSSANTEEEPEVSSTPSRPRDLLMRQHSTPAAFHQESHGLEPGSAQAEGKQRLQKSISLDETNSKTKLATCIIKSVLSKKMQHEQNLRGVEPSENAFLPPKPNSTTDNHLHSPTKETCVEATKPSLGPDPPLHSRSCSQSPPPNAEARTNIRVIKEHVCVSSKTQPKPPCVHGFSPLLGGGVGRWEYTGTGSAEINASGEGEKTEKPSPRGASQLASWSSGDKLSCDSAKGKVWNSSTGIMRVASPTAVKLTPEECNTGQAIHKQHNVKKQPLPNTPEQQETQITGNSEDPQSLTKVACMMPDLEVSHNILLQPTESFVGKEQQRDQGDAKQAWLPGSVGKLKGMAPVHVVRDVRSLVKNTYNLSFQGQGETLQGLEDNGPPFQPETLQSAGGQGEIKGKMSRQEEKPLVNRVTPPLPPDKKGEMASLYADPRGRRNSTTSPPDSRDTTVHTRLTKVGPKSNNCALAKPLEGSGSLCAFNDLSTSTNLKQMNWAEMPAEEPCGTSLDSETSEPKYERGDSSIEQRGQPTISLHSHSMATENYSTPPHPDQLNNADLPEQMCVDKDSRLTPGPPPRSQSSAVPRQTPPSACIVTVTPAPMIPSYYYKPNHLGYQTIPAPMGPFSFVPGPVLLPPPTHSQPTTVPGAVALLWARSGDTRQSAQPRPESQSPPQTESREPRLVGVLEAQHYTAPFGGEDRRGGAGGFYPDGGPNPPHLLLDPETGRCFFFDVPQPPQRKVLFDPETCQFVEVVLPQQSLPGPVLPPPCTLPFAPMPMPAMYPPQCLPYVQTHLLPPSGP